MYIPKKPAGGSLDLEMKVNYHFPYMHKPTMAGEIMPGVAYDYAVALIQSGKAVVAGVQIASKVNEDGSTGDTQKTGPASVLEKLKWGSPSAKKAETKDDTPKDKK